MKQWMKRFLKVGLIGMGLMALLSGCAGKRTATLYVSSHLSDDMVYTGDDEAAEESGEAAAGETHTLKKGDSFLGFTVTKVTAESVSFQAEYAEYYAILQQGDASRENLGLLSRFTLKAGESLTLTEAGLCDATYTVHIDCISID